MRNVHERLIDAPIDVVGALLDRLGSDNDPLWPTPEWTPIRFRGPLAVGIKGGHGPIAYTVEEYEPGRRIRCQFTNSCHGIHELVVVPHGNQTLMRHSIHGRMRGMMRLGWPLAIRWVHDALLEDLLDNAERAATGRVAKPSHWSATVRLLHRLSWPKAKAVPMPEQATLIRSAMDRPDLVDSWQIPLRTGMPTDPNIWAAALFGRMPNWVTVLMRLRNRLVGLIGIERGDRRSFDAVATTDSEHMLGTDAGHLNFRASILIGPRAVTLTTVARVHNRRGRLYLAIIRLVHPAIIRSMLRQTSRRLALAR